MAHVKLKDVWHLILLPLQIFCAHVCPHQLVFHDNSPKVRLCSLCKTTTPIGDFHQLFAAACCKRGTKEGLGGEREGVASRGRLHYAPASRPPYHHTTQLDGRYQGRSEGIQQDEPILRCKKCLTNISTDSHEQPRHGSVPGKVGSSMQGATTPGSGCEPGLRAPAALRRTLLPRKLHEKHKPRQVPISFGGRFEVDDTIAISGIWDHNMRNYCGTCSSDPPLRSQFMTRRLPRLE